MMSVIENKVKDQICHAGSSVTRLCFWVNLHFYKWPHIENNIANWSHWWKEKLAFKPLVHSPLKAALFNIL